MDRPHRVHIVSAVPNRLVEDRVQDTSTEQVAYPEGAMNTLYLAWRQPDQRWWPVGRLSREGSEYVFTYTQGARSAEEAGFRPLSSFPDFDQVYVSTQLFPTFQNRLPPQSRPDYEDFIEWMDLEHGEADPLVMLARSGGQREADMFEVFPVPERTADVGSGNSGQGIPEILARLSAP
jgi:hypothetical protein